MAFRFHIAKATDAVTLTPVDVVLEAQEGNPTAQSGPMETPGPRTRGFHDRGCGILRPTDSET